MRVKVICVLYQFGNTNKDFVCLFRGKGSRALLNWQGPIVHDASYYTAVQLEGPEVVCFIFLD